MKRKLVASLVAVMLLVVGVVLFTWLQPETTYRVATGIERSMADLESRVIAVEGHRWAYLEGGEGPTLVLVHGFSADKDNWVRVARRLSDRFHLVIPDLIGFGDSDAPEDVDYRAGAQAQRLIGFLDALGIDQAHFGGNSMGGYLVAAIASAEPERVNSLWLLAPAGVVNAPPSELMTRITNGESNPLIPSSVDDFEDTLAFVFVDPPFIPSPVRRFLAQRQVLRQDLLHRIFFEMRLSPLPLEQLLSGYQGPTLVVWGESDRVLSPAGAEIIKKVLPQAQIELMASTGHLPMIERPLASAGRYRKFQESL